MTLKAAMQKLGVQQLYEVFRKFDSSGGMRSFDKTMLMQTLNSLGIQLMPEEFDMILIEYDP